MLWTICRKCQQRVLMTLVNYSIFPTVYAAPKAGLFPCGPLVGFLCSHLPTLKRPRWLPSLRSSATPLMTGDFHETY